MDISNVNLWFAKDKYNNIITIDEVNKKDKNEYFCPICGSKVNPKQGSINSWHFAHFDKSKCDGESIIHFWVKNQLLKRGDEFVVKTNKNNKFICKEVLIEQSYQLNNKIYNPDITVITECGKTIYFEIANTNKKKIEKYLDIWIELGNIVVEVNTKDLINFKGKISSGFQALFYNGNCFNVKREDNYYNTIGKYKEELNNKGDYIKHKKELEKIDWIWNDMVKYKLGEVDIEHMTNLIDSIENKEDKDVLESILIKPRCNSLYYNYINYKLNKIYDNISIIFKQYFENDYDKYLKNEIQKYDTGKLIGYIEMLDVSDNCFCAYDIFDSNIESLIKKGEIIAQNILKYNENKNIVKLYNDFTEIISQQLSDNKTYQEYKNYIKINKQKYDIDFHVSTIYYNYNNFDISNYDINKFHITFSLKYNNGYTNACDLDTYIDKNYDINDICFLMVDKFQKYFETLPYLQNLSGLNNLLRELQDKYSGYKIEFYGKLYFEDVYEIYFEMNDRYIQDYYISNRGILSHLGIATTSRGKEMLLVSENIDEIKTFIIKDIDERIKEKLTFHCNDCKCNFNLSLEEYKFYIHKGFDMPRRCKPCRIIRKNNKIN